VAQFYFGDPGQFYIGANMGRKMNPKSQENDQQNHAFLQTPLLQISRNARQINVVRVLHGGLDTVLGMYTTAILLLLLALRDSFVGA
jgi:hypothetical protein